MQVKEEIARGGFGRVELVETANGERYARKTFDPSVPGLSGEELGKMRKRFVREVNIQRSLDSPVFVPVIDYDLSGENPWFTMPIADRSLAEEIAEAKLTGASLQDALADTLNALDELHGLGFVHRDLKPENILKFGDRWALTDFGLVMPPTGATTKLTSYASNWGTAAYCAPEQAIEFRNATAAVDIYAFGCILHDIYGDGLRVPYQRQTADGKIGLIIEKCTEQNPFRRFKSVEPLRSALLTLLAMGANVTASQSAQEWKSQLESARDWSNATFEEFAQYARRNTSNDDLYLLFSNLDEDTIQTLSEKDSDLWKTVALTYCQWVAATGFDWTYCDVLIRRLEKIFSAGDIELKATCALAAAELGRSHNRWFVMDRVMAMCGHDLDDLVAQRLQIEIRAAEVEENFRKCADVISREYSDYHPLIAGTLE